MPIWFSSRLRAKAGRWLRHNREGKRNGLSPVYSRGYRYAVNLPKHSYVFLRKHLEEGVYQVSAVSASDVLKRNTEQLMMWNVRCSVGVMLMLHRAFFFENDFIMLILDCS